MQEIQWIRLELSDWRDAWLAAAVSAGKRWASRKHEGSCLPRVRQWNRKEQTEEPAMAVPMNLRQT